MKEMAVVGVGAACGGIARYLISSAITLRLGQQFPWGTLLVNLSGSFLIGLLMPILTERFPHPYWRLLLVTGVLGGYTTFSSFEWETLMAAQHGSPGMAFLNVVGSVLLGYGAVWIGAGLTR